MIPILYAKNERDFTHNGVGFLVDVVKCTVTEERNGLYECSLQYPITGQWYDQITDGCIIKAKANDTSAPQLFRIYKSSKPLNGIVTYSAEHISYDLNGIPTQGISIKNATPQMAMTRAIEEAGLPCPFTAISDISTLNSTEILSPCSVRAILGGQTGSVLDVWGGEYEFDNFTVKLHKHRGTDRGVSIEYGKNLKDIKQETNIAECYTHLMPYAVYSEETEDGNSSEVYVYLSEKVLPLTSAENIGHYKAYIMNFSEFFEEDEEVTENNLRIKATKYATTEELGVPKVNITVSFVQLWQTEEYKNIAPLERVMLCDTVAVRFSKLGVTASAKVIKTTYNTLEEKYESIELGDAKSSFADTVNKQQSSIDEIKASVRKGQAQATERLKKAIANATNLITGHSGGYVVLNPAENPQEILILDTPSIEEAVKVWRWNSGGLGYSSTGYNGEYALAMTMDGSIVADFINAGILNGALLQADSIQSAAISQGYKSEVTEEINNSAQVVEQLFKAADAQLLSTISQTLTDYYSKSEINQTVDSINATVATKIGNSEFSTKLQQNAYAVRIAWNNNSNYIQLESGKLCIYNGIVSDSEKRAAFDETGNHFYRDGNYVGKIGTNSWVQNPEHKGLVFDLDYQGQYIAFAHKASETAPTYTTMLCFSRDNSIYDEYGLHLGCDLFGEWHKFDRIEIGETKAGAYSGYTGEVDIVETITANSNGGVDWTYSKLHFINGICVGCWI